MKDFALLYVRVSSKHQKEEGYSLDAQEKLGMEYAEKKGLKVKKLWKVFESAWRKERKAFNAMVNYAKKHSEVKHIIFDVTDRMTRNDFDKLKIIELIREFGKIIHFSRTRKIIDKNSNSEDEFMLDIEVAVAKKWSNDISRKAKMGMREKAEQGFYPSTAPIGYRNNRLTHLIDVDEEKASYIKKAFELMATGTYSLTMLSERLYSEGLRSQNGMLIKKCGIDRILKNPIYYGAFIWKEQLYQGKHPPIISKGLYEQVQSVLRRKNHPSIQKCNFEFANLIICGDCGCKVIGERKKGKYTYYHCTFSKGRHRNRSYLREEKLAKLFEEPIKRITINEEIAEWLLDGMQEKRKNLEGIQEKRLQTLESQYEKVNNRLSRLLDSKLDGEIDGEIYKVKETEYKSQLVKIKTQIESMKRINPNYFRDAQEILELSKRLYPLYLKANYSEKAKILKFVASNYTLLNVSLYPTYRKPFDILAKGPTRLKMRGRRDSNSRPPA
jgi:site-specific DNA recombinase